MLRDDYAVLSFVTANESEYVHRICGICITYTVSISTPASAVFNMWGELSTKTVL